MAWINEIILSRADNSLKQTQGRSSMQHGVHGYLREEKT